jgi:hypothetical protein
VYGVKNFVHSHEQELNILDGKDFLAHFVRTNSQTTTLMVFAKILHTSTLGKSSPIQTQQAIHQPPSSAHAEGGHQEGPNTRPAHANQFGHTGAYQHVFVKESFLRSAQDKWLHSPLLLQ